jgi:Fe-Mn family superoxide dismutase
MKPMTPPAATAFLALMLAACASAAPAPAPTGATAAPSAPAPAAFVQAPLPYAFDALAPVIDEATMRLHHGKHHAAQTAALNAAIAADPALAGRSLEDLLANASTMPMAVRNNAGGHWNHAFFWTIMAPPGTGGAPSAALSAAIARDFGGMEAMKAQFRAASLARFGSGWAWVVVRPDGRLAIGSTPNQDNPLMDVADLRGRPILGNDVWEHAYYLNYQNRRADYVDAWWSLIDWRAVSAAHAAALPSR